MTSIPTYPRLTLNKYNLEINVAPRQCQGFVIDELAADLGRHLDALRQSAAKYGTQIGLFGIAPTIDDRHTGIKWMTNSLRYQALNKAIMAGRPNKVLPIRIESTRGHVHYCEIPDFTTEGVMNSTQVHLSVEPKDFTTLYNGALLFAPVCLAVFASSPFFAYRSLWAETRIALFEAILKQRAFFGSDWVRGGPCELFAAWLDQFPPFILEEPNNLWLRTLKLRTGTVWPWIRPCVFPDHTLTLEFRSRSSGPTIIDTAADFMLIAGTALLGQKLMEHDWAGQIPFELVRDNFYTAARWGNQASLIWPDGKGGYEELKAWQILESYYQGIATMLIDEHGLDASSVNYHLAVIEHRSKHFNTSQWLDWAIDFYGPQYAMDLYLKYSQDNNSTPVSTWPHEH